MDQSTLEAFADSKIVVTQKLKFGSERVKYIVGKGENAGYKHFLPLPTMFSKVFFLGVVKTRDCWERVNTILPNCIYQHNSLPHNPKFE